MHENLWPRLQDMVSVLWVAHDKAKFHTAIGTSFSPLNGETYVSCLGLFSKVSKDDDLSILSRFLVGLHAHLATFSSVLSAERMNPFLNITYSCAHNKFVNFLSFAMY